MKIDWDPSVPVGVKGLKLYHLSSYRKYFLEEILQFKIELPYTVY